MSTVEIRRTFAAPREAVWAQWTEAEHFAGWYGGAAAEVEVHEWDLRPGGRWRATMHVSGRTIDWHGEFEVIEPPERFAFTVSDRPGDERARCTVELAAAGSSTEMTFTQTGPELPPEALEALTSGWGAFFAAMEQRLV